MGLLEALGFGGNPLYAAFDQARPSITSGFGGMLGNGNDARGALQGASKGLETGAIRQDAWKRIQAEQQAVQAKAAKEQVVQNQTVQMLRVNAPKIAAAVEAGSLSPSDGFKMYMEQSKPGGQDAPANVKEWEYFNGLKPDQQAAYLRMKRANPYLDLGNGYAQPDPVNPGSTSGPLIPKDNFTPSYDSASGTALGKVDVENKSAADSLASKLPGLKSVVAELGDLADKATYTQTGQLWDNVVRETGAMPSEGALARTKYMSMVDNQVLPLLRDTFGAAFTQKEGDSLKATLGAPDKSPAEKKAVLEAFIEQKTRDLQAMQSRLPQPGGSSGKVFTYNPATGELE